MTDYDYDVSAYLDDELEDNVADDLVDEGDGNESDPLASGSEDGREQEEDVFGASVDTLLAEGRRGSKKRRRPFGAGGSKRRPSEVPSHLAGLMGSATISFMAKKFDEAEEQLARIIQEAPKAVAPYRTLALVCEEKGDMKKSLNYLMFAAHLDRQDKDLWKRCAALSYSAKNYEDTVYCLTMALKGTFGKDAEALRARAAVFREMGNYSKAVENYVKLSKVVPSDLGVIVSLAEALELSKRPLKAEAYLVNALDYEEQHPLRSFDRDEVAAHEATVASLVERLVNIRFSQDRYEEASVLLTRFQERRSLGNVQLPFVQRVMLAVCQHRAGSRALASVAFNEFFSSPEVIASNPTLMWYVAEACFAAKDHLKTIKAYSSLAELEAYKGDLRVYLRRAEAYLQQDQLAEAESDCRHALTLVPGSAEANMLLDRILGPGEDGEGSLDAKKKSRRARHRRRLANARKRGRVIDLMDLGDLNDEPVDGLDPFFGDEKAHAGGFVQPGEGGFGAERTVGPGATGKPSAGSSHGDSSADAARATAEARRFTALRVLRRAAKTLATTAESVLQTSGPDAYLHLLAPALEAALGLPYRSLRSPHGDSIGMSGAPVDENGMLLCGEEHLIAAVQRVGEDMKGLGQVLLRGFSDEDYVTFVERVFDALRERNQSEEERYLVEVLVSVRSSRVEGVDKNLRFRLRLVSVASMIARGQASRGYEELRFMTLDRPEDGRLWWLLSQLDILTHSPYGKVDGQRLRHRILKALRRDAKRIMARNDGSGTLMLTTAAVFSVRGGMNMSTPRAAIRFFAHALRRQPTAANCALGVGVNLLIMAQSRSSVNRAQIILKAFAYIDEYRRQRRALGDKFGPVARAFVEEEMDYNIGRAMQDVGLVHLASQMYMKILERDWVGVGANMNGKESSEYDFRLALPAWYDLKRDAAFNVSQIFIASEEPGLAAAIVRKYLVF